MQLYNNEPHSATVSKKAPRLQRAYSAQDRPADMNRDKIFELKPNKHLKYVVEEDDRGRFEGYKLYGKRHGKG